VRPSHAFAAVLMATSLVAVAVPAYAGSSTDPGSAVTGAVTPGSTSSDASPSPSPSPSTDTSSASSKTASTNADSTNPLAALTPPASCTQAFGGDPTKIQQCLTDAAGALGGGSPPPQAAALQTFFTCAQAALVSQSAAAGEKCGTDLFTALGIPGADCLDPTLQPILKALDALLKNQDPSQLQTVLEGLGTTLPAQLQQLPACLNPTPSDSATPTPTPVESTTAASAPATSDPTTAIPVSATPTFTG
jgi:hypothetical protein